MGKGFCFEDFIEKFRYVVYFPIASLLLTTVLIFVWSFRGFSKLSDFHTFTGKEILIGFISTFELYLLAIVSMIFAVSLYEIYIKKPGKSSKLPESLKIYTLEEMKAKVSKIVYLILLVIFFEIVIGFDFNSAQEILMLAASILLVALSIKFTKAK